MSRIVVDLSNKTEEAPANVPLSDYSPRKGRRGLRMLAIFCGVLAFIAIVAGISGLLYWRHLKTTPQYSLALLIDAARRDDQGAVDELVDTDAVVEDFVPQITGKAVELYGRGLAPEIIGRIATVAAPVMPFVKERARAELPRLIKERTERYKNVPFFVMAAGADRYLDIAVDGDTAKVSGKPGKNRLEVVLKRNGERWQIVAVKDEALARRIAEKVGQQIISLAKERGTETINKVGRKIGLENLGDLIKKAEDIFK